MIIILKNGLPGHQKFLVFYILIPEVQPKNFNPGYISYAPDTTYDSIESESERFNDENWQNRNTKKTT